MNEFLYRSKQMDGGSDSGAILCQSVYTIAGRLKIGRLL